MQSSPLRHGSARVTVPAAILTLKLMNCKNKSINNTRKKRVPSRLVSDGDTNYRREGV